MLILFALSACLLGGGLPAAEAARPDAGPSMQDPRRAFAELSAGEAARKVRTSPLGEQFGAAFAYGEGAGLTEDLGALLSRARVMPVGLRGPFMDGAAHTWAPPDGVPVAVVVQEIDQTLPVAWREAFHNGVLVSWSIASGGDPARVVPRAESYAAVRGEPPLDGVRIGLQRVQGDDLPRALAVAAAYPVAYQPALFEELGWRAGDDGGAVCGLAATVPEDQRCAFVHGAARGLTLRTDWEAQDAARGLGERVAATTCGCAAAAWRGVAWGLALRWGHRPQRAETLARRVDDTVDGAAIGPALRPLLHGPRAAPWVGIGD